MNDETNDTKNRELRELEVKDMAGWGCNTARNFVSKSGPPADFARTLERELIAVTKPTGAKGDA